jgi:hypothetical protein
MKAYGCRAVEKMELASEAVYNVDSKYGSLSGVASVPCREQMRGASTVVYCLFNESSIYE